MTDLDYLGSGGAIKLLEGDVRHLHDTSEVNFSHEIRKFLLSNRTLPERCCLTLKAEFINKLVDSKKYPLYSSMFEGLTYEEKESLLLPKTSLEEGAFGLIESWYSESPQDTWERIIFIGTSLIGEFLGIELNPHNLSIVEGLQNVGDICKISSTGGAELNHKLVAVI